MTDYEKAVLAMLAGIFAMTYATARKMASPDTQEELAVLVKETHDTVASLVHHAEGK